MNEFVFDCAIERLSAGAGSTYLILGEAGTVAGKLIADHAPALDRVFGSASHANAATLTDLSPRMDELFLSALKELSVAQSRRST